MINENEFIFYIENSCVAYEQVENNKGLEAYKYMNSLGIALYFYFKDQKGKYKHYDDHDRFIRDLNK